MQAQDEAVAGLETNQPQGPIKRPRESEGEWKNQLRNRFGHTPTYLEGLLQSQEYHHLKECAWNDPAYAHLEEATNDVVQAGKYAPQEQRDSGRLKPVDKARTGGNPDDGDEHVQAHGVHEPLRGCRQAAKGRIDPTQPAEDQSADQHTTGG